MDASFTGPRGPEEPCYVFCARRHQVYHMFDTDGLAFFSTNLISPTHHKAQIKEVIE